jgi:Family of unknown function (DUF6232)
MSFCSKCGSQATGAFCAQCGAELQIRDNAAQPAARTQKAVDQVLFENNEILVTNSRFAVGPQTYAINGVTSVTMQTEMPSRKGPAILVGLGLLIIGLNPNLTGYSIGGMLALAGVFWWLQIKQDCSVLLKTAAGEIKAVTSKDPAYIGAIVEALNEAIVIRG